jgi:hypothetical protein
VPQGLRVGLFLWYAIGMPAEPTVKRTIAFFDGQNLYHTAKKVFGYTYPNYDHLALATLVCKQQDWQLQQTRFYTGVPSAVDDPHWNGTCQRL